MEETEWRKFVEGLSPDIRMAIEAPTNSPPADTQMLRSIVAYLGNYGILLEAPFVEESNEELLDAEFELHLGWFRLVEALLADSSLAGEIHAALKETFEYVKYPPVDVVKDEDRLPGDPLIGKGAYDGSKYDNLLGKRNDLGMIIEHEDGHEVQTTLSDGTRALKDMLRLLVLVGRETPQDIQRALNVAFNTRG